MQTIRALIDVLPQRGTVEWIGVRPARHAPTVSVDAVDARVDLGLDGDHYASRGGKRQVTLIQAEHLEAVASMIGVPAVAPADLRRNLVVRGLNLLALKDKRFLAGDAVLEYTGLCHPCSRMEAALGPGGYNALRGHGGITARVVTSGRVALGSAVAIA
jgi:MOSC domain-containing protein YiiM